MTTLVMESDTETRVVVEDKIQTSNDKPNSKHIVMVPPDEDDETPQAYVMRARIEGFPIVALCGHVFVPHQNPAGMPVCQACKDIYDNDPNALDPGRELPDE